MWIEGVAHGALEPHRGDEKKASVAGHRSPVAYFRGSRRRVRAAYLGVPHGLGEHAERTKMARWKIPAFSAPRR
ncbi:MAG: hypothetical protein D6723_15120 [Acidobacteria bacterium]|nr:MAG: hypothetical protein D6723_15120 [Acidobacteriota bacterium]